MRNLQQHYSKLNLKHVNNSDNGGVFLGTHCFFDYGLNYGLNLFSFDKTSKCIMIKN